VPLQFGAREVIFEFRSFWHPLVCYCLDQNANPYKLFDSPEAKEVYALRKTTIEPFQGQLKSLFGLEYLPIKGLLNVRTLCTLATVAYSLLVMLNIRLERPATQLKATMLALR
jgi:hypothetical protein